jgi:serine/threonine-protein phosphatase 6 regulatory subunit 3
LAQSTFDIGNPPVSARHHSGDRRPLRSSGFDDAFDPRDASSELSDPFRAVSDDDNDAFGPFSDSAAASGEDPFTFPSSFADEDSTFDTFGDFGEFQTARDGELTPTAGSWTFTSGLSASDEWSEGSGHTEARDNDESGSMGAGEGYRTATDF